MKIKIYFFLTVLLCWMCGIHSKVYGQQLKISELSEGAKDQLVNFQSLLERYQREGNKVQEAEYLNKIAYLYLENGSSLDAVDFFSKSIEINKDIGNNNALQAIYTNIGSIYYDEFIYDKSEKYFNLSLAINRSGNKKRNICENLINLALAQGEQKDYHKAIVSLNEGYTLATELNDIRRIKTCVGMLSENHRKLGELEKAQFYLEQYTALESKLHKDAMNKVEKKAEEVEIEKLKAEQKLEETSKDLKVASKQVETKEKELEEFKYLQELEEQKRIFAERERDAKQKVQFTIVFSIIGVLFVILLVIYIFYKRNKKINALLAKQNDEIRSQRDIIETVNKNITNSINYAQRIQKALLPPAANIKKIIPESFIFFQPRDIVSGDFYWFTETKLNTVITQSGDLDLYEFSVKSTNKIEEGYLISAIDCTGHGVPGAFMSMIGYNLLDEILSYGVTEPGKMLKLLNQGVRNQLKQKETDNQDGMDMVLCLINKDKNKVTFAGAKNPLVYVKNNEIFQIKGDYLPIGGFYKADDERNYTSHEIEVDVPTTFYLFSDGYSDQIGGNEGRKFLSKYFRNFLLEISSSPMDEQSTLLKNKLTQWMGKKYDQVDDILVMGFKLYPKK